MKFARLHSRGAVCWRLLFCIAGWSLAVLFGCLIVPRLYQRMVVRFPSLQEEVWRRTMEYKKEQLRSTTWKDSRPLHIFAGDSHVELGSWYDLCAGRLGVRNCGLSRAKIEEVKTLVAAVPDRGMEMVLLMCGINNLGGGESVESCAKKYEDLLATVRDVLQPRKIMVMSVMPVRQSGVDEHGRKLNAEVFALNERLVDVCRRQDIIFIDLKEQVTDSRGALRKEFTMDGLHLNAEGYRSVASKICDALSSPQP